MTIPVVASGTQAATIGTEHTLVTDTANHAYVLVVDTNAMVNGDVLELRIKTKVLSGSASRLAYIAIYAHVQAMPNKYSTPVPANIEIVCTLKQTAGTGRSYDWSLLNID